MYLHVCEQCGESFESKKKTSRFCSRDCKNASQKKPEPELTYYDFVCQFCGEAFKSRNKNAKFCSLECFGLNKARPFIPCVECGTLHQNQKYCSLECHDKNKKGPRNLFDENGKKIETYGFCPVCGDPIKRQAEACSVECANELKRSQRPLCIVCGTRTKAPGRLYCSSTCLGIDKKVEISSKGYPIVDVPDDFPDEYLCSRKTKSSRRAFEYHVVWWQHHGYLPRHPNCIHHINLDKTDSRISNLQEMTYSEHAALHRLIESHVKCYTSPI